MTSKAGAQRRENNETRAETKSGGKKTDPDYRFSGAAARDPVALAARWYPGSLLSGSLTRMFHKLTRIYETSGLTA
ncbi:MAG: hypothetical protein L0H12_00080 [Nitrosospira sp.]|nr:hypothetical protein [Nitrosospira sp.]MDN5881014.1 hypothetical protein [Nitrosospira sp.]MDN5935408.1 hypothetical protein [Nitrosospira sp.]